jgi:regulation of enolase protein 1 (concanavalin A-like superfamily)
MVIVSPGKGIVMQYRTVESGASASTPARAGAAPKWVRLTRRGDTFIGETSSDGSVWIEIGRMTMALTSTRVGLAVTSHNNGTLATAAFDDISIRRPF